MATSPTVTWLLRVLVFSEYCSTNQNLFFNHKHINSWLQSIQISHYARHHFQTTPTHCTWKTRGIDWWLLVWIAGIACFCQLLEFNQNVLCLIWANTHRRTNFSCQSKANFSHATITRPVHSGEAESRKRTRNARLLNCPSIKSVIKKFINFLRHSGSSGRVTYTSTATRAHTAFIAALIRRDKSFEMRSSLVIIIHREQGGFLCAVASAFVCWFFRMFLI